MHSKVVISVPGREIDITDDFPAGFNPHPQSRIFYGREMFAVDRVDFEYSGKQTVTIVCCHELTI